VAPTSASRPLVGRTAELAHIREALRDPATAAVLLLGAPGVGKTRLAEAVCAERADTNTTTIRISASREGSGFPLAALAPLLVRPPSRAAAVARDPVRLLADLQAIIAETGNPPRLMFVDDLPLLDPLSAVLISQLVESRSVVLLATVRTGEPLPDMYHGRWTGDGMVRIDLPALTERDCARLLAGALGGPVAAKSVGRLHAMSGGLPLHLRELALTAVADGSLRQVEGVWQLAAGELRNPALAQILAARFDRLDPDSVALIRRIAVTQPLELDDFDDDVTDRLVILEQAGLVEVGPTAIDTARNVPARGDPASVGAAGTGDWWVRLAHPAYADVIRSEMSRLQIRKLLLDQIARVRARDRGLTDVVRLSIWQLEATGSGEPGVLVAAARLARQGHEFALVRQLAAAAVDSDPVPSAESLLLLGEAMRELGDGIAAGPVLDRAAMAPGPPEVLARVAIIRSGLAGHGQNRPDLAAEMLARARDDIPEEADQLSLSRAVMLIVGERMADAQHELAGVDASVAREPDLVALYFLGMVGALVGAGRPAEALAAADQLLPLLHTEGNLFHDGMPMMLRASALLDLSGPATALPDATAALRECLNSGVDRLICYAASQLCTVQLAAGKPRTAARWAREVISVARSAGHHSFLSVGMSGLATALATLGDVPGSTEAIRALSEEKRSYPGPDGPPPSWEIRAQAWTLAAQGRLSAATALLEDGAARAFERGHSSAAANLLHDAVRVGGAKAALPGLRRAADTCPSPQIERQCRQAAATEAGDVDALVAVAEEWAAGGNRLFAAEAMLTAATAASSQGMARRVGTLRARGAELAAGCQGAQTPGLTVAGSVDPLSPREREIAAMASQGLRSREIAESLVVSIRTVDNHLQAVYGKLGITGRRELADALRASR